MHKKTTTDLISLLVFYDFFQLNNNVNNLLMKNESHININHKQTVRTNDKYQTF